MNIGFIKMHGLGNDYVYFDCMAGVPDGLIGLTEKISDRRFGVGGDGIVLIMKSEVADARMRMFNLDGSEGKMCGNAIRCVGKYLFETGICKKQTLTVETGSGIKTLSLEVSDGKVTSVTVDMGAPIIKAERVPCRFAGEKMIDDEVYIKGKPYKLTAVSMGNPHAVRFFDDVESIDVEKLSKDLQSDDFFPEGVNVEYAVTLNKRALRMRVCERGSGETAACGTGACAATVASVLTGRADRNEWITVKLNGGDLYVKYTGETVLMKGSATEVFRGVLDTEALGR